MSARQHPTPKSPRLLLRPWRDADLAPHAAMNADPRVMEHFPATLTRQESDARVARLRDHFDRHGFGMWAVEAPGVADFIGSVGIIHVSFEAHFAPAVEIGWRLVPEHWGKGYATEAAAAALCFGFDALGLDEIVAFTVLANLPSRRVMERLGMTTSPADDFDHPKVPAGHSLGRCVLYRIGRHRWQSRRNTFSPPVFDGVDPTHP